MSTSKVDDRIFIGLGSNLGDRLHSLKQAVLHLEVSGIHIVAASAVYETAAWGMESQPDFLNQVVEVCVALSPWDLLKQLLSIEAKMGRVRQIKWGERSIDLDILYYGEQIVDEPGLQIPHPGIPERPFVLIPMVELAPKFEDPRTGNHMSDLLKNCKTKLDVSRFSGG